MAKPYQKKGYANNKPPVWGQFKPGTSPHPAGRPKGSRNHRTILEDELKKTIAVTENGKRVRKKKWSVIVAQQVNKAVGGDLKAAQFVTEQMVRYGLLSDESGTEFSKIGPADEIVIEELTRRIRASQSENERSEPAADEPDHENPDKKEDQS